MIVKSKCRFTAISKTFIGRTELTQNLLLVVGAGVPTPTATATAETLNETSTKTIQRRTGKSSGFRRLSRTAYLIKISLSSV